MRVSKHGKRAVPGVGNGQLGSQYCALDTFAMVKVWEALLQVVDDPIYRAVSELTKKYEEKMF